MKATFAILALIVIGLSAMINLVTNAQWTWIPGGLAALFFVFLEWARLARAARILFAVLIGIVVTVSLTVPDAFALLHLAAERAVYLGYFVLAMGVLQATAASSPLVHRSVVSRMLWKFPGGMLRAWEGSCSQAARSRGIGSMG